MVAAARAEIRRRWRERGELWLTCPDWDLARADYLCAVCGAHVLDENYLLCHPSVGARGGAWWGRVSRACCGAAGNAEADGAFLADSGLMLLKAAFGRGGRQ